MLTREERYRWHYSEQAPGVFVPNTRIPLPSYYTGDNIKIHISNLILVNYNITTTHYIIHIMVYMLNGMLNPCGDQYTAYNISGSIFLWCPPSLEFCLSTFIFFVTVVWMTTIMIFLRFPFFVCCMLLYCIDIPIPHKSHQCHHQRCCNF